MPFADELVRVAMKWQGASSSGWPTEEAITTYWLRHHHITGNGFTWHDQMPHLASDLWDKWVAHWSLIEGWIGHNYQVTEIKVEHVDAAGHALDVAAFTGSPGSLSGSSTANLMPPEVALAISHWAYEPGTFATHKGRKRGRFYLPYISSSLSTAEGRVDGAHLSDVADAFQTLFNDIQGMHTFNEDTPPDVNPDFWDFVVVSRVDGTWDNVGWISCDDKFDSQRRRQHQSPSARQVRTISH